MISVQKQVFASFKNGTLKARKNTENLSCINNTSVSKRKVQ